MIVDKISITISTYTLTKLIKLHDTWKRQNKSMANQDIDYVIARLIEREKDRENEIKNS